MPGSSGGIAPMLSGGRGNGVPICYSRRCLARRKSTVWRRWRLNGSRLDRGVNDEGATMDTVINRIGDELGLTPQDLARLYGINEEDLSEHLTTLGADVDSIYQQVLSDVDAVRVGYRQLQITDGQIKAIRGLLR